MSRINTNVNSLVAQTRLQRSNSQLQEALTRLSTGLRINAGKDDPAGLIASETLRSDITSVNKAVTNSERANQVIATADSALGQISNLLNDVRGLVTEAANSGVLSEDQINANQLQIDSSLEAIDRISQTTTFQGRKLLDGSLDFTSNVTAGASSVRDLRIEQANLGATGSVGVNVTIQSAATKALVTTAIPAGTTPTAASATLTFGDTSTVTVTAAATGAAAGAAGNGFVVNLVNDNTITAGTATATYNATSKVITVKTNGDTTKAVLASAIDGLAEFDATSGGGGIGLAETTDALGTQSATGAGGVNGTAATQASTAITFADTSVLNVTADAAGAAAGATGNGFVVNIVDNNTVTAGTATAAYNSGTKVITVNVNGDTAIGTIATAVNGLADFNATSGGGGVGYVAGTDPTGNQTPAGSGGANAVAATQATASLSLHDGSTIAISAAAGGAADGATGNGFTVNFVANTSIGAGTATASYNSGTKVITVNINGNTSKGVIATAINGLADFNATAGGSGTRFIATADPLGNQTPAGSGGAGAAGGLVADLVVKLSGSSGSEVFNFGAGATADQITSALNLLSDSTGVTATNNANTLELRSAKYGSDQFVDVEVISEGSGGTFKSGLSANRANGTNVVAKVNGYTANGLGNTISVNTSTLDFNLTVADGSTTSVSFNVTGGGAVFQLGPDVVSNQQARIGIGSVNTGTLGGVSGRLYELRSGAAKSLKTSPSGAANVVDEVINKITSLRGRLGAFQRTTLETNINSLNDTLSNLTEAESAIRDADFAAETAKLTRAQILVQSGTSVLQISNQNPQQILALLRG